MLEQMQVQGVLIANLCTTSLSKSSPRSNPQVVKFNIDVLGVEIVKNVKITKEMRR